MQERSPPPKVPRSLGRVHGPQADLGNRNGGPNRRNDAMVGPVVLHLVHSNDVATSSYVPPPSGEYQWKTMAFTSASSDPGRGGPLSINSPTDM